jgi:probable rRNA maturation factor
MTTQIRNRGIIIHLTKSFQGIDVSLPKLKKLAKAVCERFEISKAAVSIVLIDNAEIRKANKCFLGRDSTTDCLSFDLSDVRSKTRSFELLVNAEKAVEEAVLRSHSSEAELALYITHGLLHQLGFDDSTVKLAKKMHLAEDEILQQLGYGAVFNKKPKPKNQCRPLICQ